MADNTEKLPLPTSLNQTAINRAGDASQALGKDLPCTVVKVVSSGIVEVSFQVQGYPTLPNVTIPVGWSEYTRLPVQAGMKGVAKAADARLGGLSGLGSGVANLTRPANLQALAFHPLGSTTWQAVINGNTLVFYGEPNVQIQDKTGAAVVNISTTAISLMLGGKGIVITSAGTTIDGILFLPHNHTGVTSGSDLTGPVGT